MNNTDIDADRRPSTATCPRCRPGRVWSYSWRPLGATGWLAALWCDTPSCLPRIVLCDRVQAARATAEAEALRLWSARAVDVCEQQVGGAA